LISRAAACFVPLATLRAYQSALRAAGIMLPSTIAGADNGFRI
jgi:hypothetical protein